MIGAGPAAGRCPPRPRREDDRVLARGRGHLDRRLGAAGRATPAADHCPRHLRRRVRRAARTGGSGRVRVGAEPRERVWHVRAKRVVLATGAHERLIAFADCDRPGRDARRRGGALRRAASASRPGRRAVVFTTNDAAYDAAFALQDAGRRDRGDRRRSDRRADRTPTARDEVIEVLAGWAVAERRGRSARREGPTHERAGGPRRRSRPRRGLGRLQPGGAARAGDRCRAPLRRGACVLRPGRHRARRGSRSSAPRRARSPTPPRSGSRLPTTSPATTSTSSATRPSPTSRTRSAWGSARSST